MLFRSALVRGEAAKLERLALPAVGTLRLAIQDVDGKPLAWERLRLEVADPDARAALGEAGSLARTLEVGDAGALLGPIALGFPFDVHVQPRDSRTEYSMRMAPMVLGDRVTERTFRVGADEFVVNGRLVDETGSPLQGSLSCTAVKIGRAHV